MVSKPQNKKKLIITIILLVMAALVICALAFFGKKESPTPAAMPSPIANNTEPTATDETPNLSDSTDTPPEKQPTVLADPKTLNSVAIEPLSITVFYSKGTPGFEYAIKKTADKTEYVEFSSTELVGTKCTDDQGMFASVIKNPTSAEDQTTISQTVKVGSDTYGLSLAGAGCTSNAELLTTYQTGFKNGFSSLTAL